MSEDSILDTMRKFTGRMLITMSRSADDLLKQKLNDGIAVLIGSAVNHFSVEPQATVEAIDAGTYFDGPGLEMKIARTSWKVLARWMDEAYPTACQAGLDVRLQVSNIEGDPDAHAKGDISVIASFSYLPEELNFIQGADRPIGLVSIANKLREAWAPRGEEGQSGEDASE